MVEHRSDHHRPFGGGGFGLLAERFARFFGTPKFIVSQTVMILCWIILNCIAVDQRWDAYPFILLNLLFSTQAAYAAPLILLAQTRQADRDKIQSDLDTKHREKLSDQQLLLLEKNTNLTELAVEQNQRIEALATELHAHIKVPRTKKP